MFRINKTKKDVELHLAGSAEPVSGSVFLNTSSQAHHGAERILDLLSGTDLFVPFLTQAGQMWIVQKNAIRKIIVDSAFELEILRSYGDESILLKQVSVRMITGETVEGEIVIERKEGASRVLDEVNRKPGFLLLQNGDLTSLIGLRFVASILEKNSEKDV
jgi:hypothetical protein